jgi:hypothetical protein
VDHQPRTDILVPKRRLGGPKPTQVAWFLAALTFLTDCPKSSPAVPPDLKAVGGQVSLIRIPTLGGTVEAFDPDSLGEPIWTSRVALAAVREVLGVNLEARLLVAVDTLKNLVMVDLESRGLRGQTPGIESAVMVPDGSVFAVNAARKITRIGAGLPVPYRIGLPLAPVFQTGSLGERYIAVLGTKPPKMLVINPERQLEDIPILSGAIAASYWGELVAVAADDRVVIYGTEEPFATQTIKVTGHPRQVLFSPSAHRLYLTRDDATVLVYDRFGLSKISEIKLPGVPAALRIDGSGRWLLARPATGDSTWVADLATGSYAATVTTTWEDDLPTVAGASTVLTRHQGDLVAVSIGSKVTETGRISGGAADRWVVTAWIPRDRLGRAAAAAESLLVAQDSLLTPDSATAAAVGDRLYLQVSSSQNPDWSKELAKQLTQGGYPAKVLDPTTADDGYRVVVGPYDSREAAEETGRKLGRPYFILTNPPRRD